MYRLKRFIAATVFVLLIVPSVSAARMNVLDYYRIIPSQYFLPELRDFAGSKPSDRDASLKVIPNTGDDDQKPMSIVDAKNGYLRAPTENSYGDGDQAIVVDVFTYKGKDTIAVESHQCGLSNCKSQLSFLRYKSNTWSNVTDLMLTAKIKKTFTGGITSICQAEAKKYDTDKNDLNQCIANRNQLVYTMPQKGTTIKVWFKSLPFYKLEWKNGSFKPAKWTESDVYFF